MDYRIAGDQAGLSRVPPTCIFLQVRAAAKPADVSENGRTIGGISQSAAQNPSSDGDEGR